MEKFTDVYDRWEQGCLSQAEAAEIQGKSERTFRRYIDVFETEGLEGLRDGRLGRVSEKAMPPDAVERILALHRSTHQGWNVTHFHEHVVKHHGYTLADTCLKRSICRPRVWCVPSGARAGIGGSARGSRAPVTRASASEGDLRAA